MWKKRNDRPNVGGVSFIGVGTVLRLERDAWSMAKGLRQAIDENPHPRLVLENTGSEVRPRG